MPRHQTILLAPTLPCEESLSMDLYLDDLLNAFQLIEAPYRFENIVPDSRTRAHKLLRYYLRNVVYPFQVRVAARSGHLLHVLDHSNGHLCYHHPRSVVTCHDIAEYRETTLSSTQLKHWKWRVRGIQHARKIIAVSECTKNDLIHFLGIAPEKIDVIYNGLDDHFFPRSRKLSLSKFPQLNPHSLKILHVGSNISRKNLPVLLRALALLKQKNVDFQFIKVGKPFEDPHLKLIDEGAYRENVILLSHISNEALPFVYSACDVFVFPSTYEGFGRPITEAQACGTPVILAGSSCLPEIGGEAALYFDPHDQEALTQHLLQLTPEKVEHLRTLGLQNIKRFQWKTHAQQLVEVYESVSKDRVPQV